MDTVRSHRTVRINDTPCIASLALIVLLGSCGWGSLVWLFRAFVPLLPQ